MTAVITTHIVLDDEGVAWVESTRTKVVEIALDQIAHGWSPEEIHRQHPHLSLASIYAALSYYHDHRAELDALIAASLTAHDAALAASFNSPLRQRLRAAGKL